MAPVNQTTWSRPVCYSVATERPGQLQIWVHSVDNPTDLISINRNCGHSRRPAPASYPKVPGSRPRRPTESEVTALFRTSVSSPYSQTCSQQDQSPAARRATMASLLRIGHLHFRRRQQVPVHVHGDADRRVPERVRTPPRAAPPSQARASTRVPELMDAPVPETRRLADPLHRLFEDSGSSGVPFRCGGRRWPVGGLVDGEVAQLGAELVGSGRDQAAHLVDGLSPADPSRRARNPQDTHGLNISVPGLGRSGGVAPLGGPGGGHGVFGV